MHAWCLRLSSILFQRCHTQRFDIAFNRRLITKCMECVKFCGLFNSICVNPGLHHAIQEKRFESHHCVLSWWTLGILNWPCTGMAEIRVKVYEPDYRLDYITLAWNWKRMAWLGLQGHVETVTQWENVALFNGMCRALTFVCIVYCESRKWKIER